MKVEHTDGAEESEEEQDAKMDMRRYVILQTFILASPS
jgi:hypothetical protein